jgi:hypothetical protein
MKKFLFWTIVIATLAVPIANAGDPDTAPSVTWTTTLPEPNGDPCNSSVGQGTENLAVVVSQDGFIYTGERCKTSGGTTDSIVIRRVTSSGVILWTQRIVSGVAGGSTTLQSLSVDPAGRLWIWYSDSTQSTYAGMLVVKDTDGNTDLVKSNADFIQSPSVRRTSFEEINATIFRAYSAGGAYRIGYECPALDSCTELYELSGQPAGSAHHAAPYYDRLFHIGLMTPTDAAATIVNQVSGAILDTETVSGMTTQESDRFRGWYNPSTDTFAAAFPRQTAGAYRPYYVEFNATTLALVRNIEPTGSLIFGYSEAFVSDSIIDGDGNVFVCGYTTGGAFGQNSYLSKYNSTSFMGRRWNITINDSAGGFETPGACDLGPDGSIYIGTYSCVPSGSTGCTSTLRKYAGIATSREPQELYLVPGSGGSTSTAPGSGNFASNAVSYCSDQWGFDCGWLFSFAILGVVLIALKDARTLIIVILAFLLVIGFVTMGWLEEWVILALVFITIVFAGVQIFGDKGEGGD